MFTPAKYLSTKDPISNGSLLKPKATFTASQLFIEGNRNEQ
jgi:hypothetical protein